MLMHIDEKLIYCYYQNKLLQKQKASKNYFDN